MASVNLSVEVTLIKEEKELLERAIAKIKDIYKDVINANSGSFINETDIYETLFALTEQYDGKLPTVIEIIDCGW